MKRVTGIGGIFFKAKDPQAMTAWYKKHLGLPVTPHGMAIFNWREADDPENEGMTIWTPFPKDTKYFRPSKAPFMINYRVENLARLVKQLRREGVTVEESPEISEFGRFAWVMDPEGNRLELWEPPAEEKEQ